MSRSTPLRDVVSLHRRWIAVVEYSPGHSQRGPWRPTSSTDRRSRPAHFQNTSFRARGPGNPPTMPTPAVLFDIDGTLIDSNYLHVHAWQRAFREVGADVEA